MNYNTTNAVNQYMQVFEKSNIYLLIVVFIVILIAYISTILYMPSRYIILITCLLTCFIIYYYIVQSDNNNNNKNQISSNSHNNNGLSNFMNCQEPSVDNPYMNISVDDIMSNSKRLPACDNDLVNDKINEIIDNNYNKLSKYNIPDHEKDRYISNRQFYTTAVTTIPNDQTSFAKWLNDVPVTCKEDQRYCLKYEDIRFNRYNPYTDNPARE